VTASHITSITETVRLDRHVAPVLWPNLEDSTTVLQHQHHVSHSFSSTSLSLAAFVYCSQFIPGKPEHIPSHSFFYQPGEKLRNFFIRLQIFSTSWWKRMAIYMPGLNWLQLKNAAIAYFWWCSRVEYRTKIYLMSVQIYFGGGQMTEGRGLEMVHPSQCGATGFFFAILHANLYVLMFVACFFGGKKILGYQYLYWFIGWQSPPQYSWIGTCAVVGICDTTYGFNFQ